MKDCYICTKPACVKLRNIPYCEDCVPKLPRTRTAKILIPPPRPTAPIEGYQ